MLSERALDIVAKIYHLQPKFSELVFKRRKIQFFSLSLSSLSDQEESGESRVEETEKNRNRMSSLLPKQGAKLPFPIDCSLHKIKWKSTASVIALKKAGLFTQCSFH